MIESEGTKGEFLVIHGVAVPWVRFGGGSDDLPQKKSLEKKIGQKSDMSDSAFFNSTAFVCYLFWR